jgi:hypothetical protein
VDETGKTVRIVRIVSTLKTFRFKFILAGPLKKYYNMIKQLIFSITKSIFFCFEFIITDISSRMFDIISSEGILSKDQYT